MNSTPIGCDLFWHDDPLPPQRSPRPKYGADREWWRETSRDVLEERKRGGQLGAQRGPYQRKSA